MRSAVYEGVVRHRRHAASATGGVANQFEHRVSMPFIFLDELDEFLALHPLWSTRRWSPVRFRRSDYLGDAASSLDTAVRDAVEVQLGRRPHGPIAMLSHLRTWGWLFNPLTLYYCYLPDGEGIDAVVLEVTSTPWRERHVYVVDGADRHSRFPKEMHVSPFMGMELDYVMTWDTPSQHLTMHLGSRQSEERVFDAGFVLSRRAATRRELAKLVWGRPLQTYGVSADIYRRALQLLWKGAPFHPRRGMPPSLQCEAQIHSGPS